MTWAKDLDLRRKLIEFLESAANEIEIRRIVLHTLGTRACLPGGNASIQSLVDSAVDQLWRHRAIDNEFFNTLCAMYPRRVEIEDLRTHWRSSFHPPKPWGHESSPPQLMSRPTTASDLSFCLAVGESKKILPSGVAYPPNGTFIVTRMANKWEAKASPPFTLQKSYRAWQLSGNDQKKLYWSRTIVKFSTKNDILTIEFSDPNGNTSLIRFTPETPQ